MYTKRIVIMVAALGCMVLSIGVRSADAEKAGAAGGDKAMAESKAVAVVSIATPRRSRATEDARHCLKAGDNLAIIRCAEQYR